MVTLGEIARQAGVRPPLAVDGQGEATASGAAAYPQIPILHEPTPSPAPVIDRRFLDQPASLAKEGRAAERSASAVDLYERAIRDAERASEEDQQAVRE